MLNKLTLLTSLGLLCSLLFTTDVLAQQPSKSAIGNYLAGSTNNDEALKSNRRRSRDSRTPRSRNEQFRSINGTNNNTTKRSKTTWGAANTNFYRELPADYGISDPNNALNSDHRPSPREISNLVCDEPVTQFNVRGLNTMLYFWGQFIDHDMTSTPAGNTEYMPIALPEDEPLFTEAIPFFRSDYDIVNSKREQINNNTAFLDASVVYGSDTERATWLRSFTDGKLKTSEGNYLPYNTYTGEITGDIDPDAPEMDDIDGTTKTFVAGDHRASENTILTAIQTVFLREHNRICDQLIEEGFSDDEMIYQLARKKVGGIIQAITYQEFLPGLGIDLKRYRGYKNDVRPDIMNTFATASYRFGHTQVSDDVVVVDNECEELGPGEFELVEAFFNPELFVAYGPEAFLKGATVHRLYKTDTKINDVLRNFLFGNVEDEIRFGIDLGSLNIQRGRDHGLPDYNTARKYYTGRKAERFSDISSNDTVATNLETLYNDINHIDLWVGILSEDQLENSSVGKTMHNMLAKQFENLRDGDFYYFENDPFLSNSQKRSIKNTTLTDVIHRNTTLTSLFANAFEMDICFGDGVPEDFATNKAANNIAGIYPNPVDNVLRINFSEPYKSGTIQLYSLSGALIQSQLLDGSQQNLQLDLANMESGIYLLKTRTDNNPEYVQKIAKL
ncbi:hypothetical protein GCM10022393_26730 [Aquimarina addita]|uniref:Secretion system C-terminal sorting domain-containing protein n=1 Tax=Aquimarina addita TaxID=870485 RepID=A0ABP6UPB2_9FLAO